MKKKFLKVILALLFAFFISQQIFWYKKYDGNLIINVTNVTNYDTINIEVLIDGEQVIKDELSNEFFGKSYRFKKSLGKHTILIKNKETNTSYELDVRVNIIKWIDIELQYDEFTTDTNNKYNYMISKYVKPHMHM